MSSYVIEVTEFNFEIKSDLRGPQRPLESFKAKNMNVILRIEIIGSVLKMTCWIRGSASDWKSRGPGSKLGVSATIILRVREYNGDHC